MGVKIQLFEVGAYRSDFCLWGLMKSEVYKEKVNNRRKHTTYRTRRKFEIKNKRRIGRSSYE